MATHDELWAVCPDGAAWIARAQDPEMEWRPDCSCGCIHFHPLDGRAGMDWGVCTCPASPRAGLLTFEHMGCDQFEDQASSTPPDREGTPGALLVTILNTAVIALNQWLTYPLHDEVLPGELRQEVIDVVSAMVALQRAIERVG